MRKFLVVFLLLASIIAINAQNAIVTDIKVASFDESSGLLSPGMQNASYTKLDLEFDREPVFFSETSNDNKFLKIIFMNTSGRDEYYVKSVNDGLVEKVIFRQSGNDYEMTINATTAFGSTDLDMKKSPAKLTVMLFAKDGQDQSLVKGEEVYRKGNYTNTEVYNDFAGSNSLVDFRFSTNKNESSAEFAGVYDRTRIVFEFSSPTSFELDRQSQFIKVKFGSFKSSARNFEVNNQRIGLVSLGDLGSATIATINNLVDVAHIKDFVLTGPDRVVLDIYTTSTSNEVQYPNAEVSETPEPAPVHQDNTTYVDPDKFSTNMEEKPPVQQTEGFKPVHTQESDLFVDEEVEYYLFKKGSEYLNMNQIDDAEMVFKRIIDEYPHSKLVPATKFQLDVIEGRRNELAMVKEEEIPPQPIEQVPEDAFGYQKISIDVKNVPILQVLKVLSKKSGYDIIASNEVQGSVSISVEDKSLKTILDLIVKTNGLRYERMDETIYVGTDEQIRLGTSIEMEIFEVKHTEAGRIKSIIDPMLPEGASCSVDEKGNNLIIMAPGNLVRQLGELISKLDEKPGQILFQTKIIELKGKTAADLGFDFGGGNSPYLMEQDEISKEEKIQMHNNSEGLKFKTYKQIDTQELNARLGLLFHSGDAKILASSKIATLDNETAKILIGNRMPVLTDKDQVDGSLKREIEYIETGIILNITPQLTSENDVTIKIKPEISQIVDFNDDNMPLIKTREASSTLRVKDGEAIFLGGLLNEENFEDVYKIPILGDIPLIGNFFRITSKSTRQTDLIILITPYLNYDSSGDYTDNLMVAYPQQ